MKTMHRILFADSLFWLSRPILKLMDIRFERAVVRRKGIRWCLDLRESIDLSLFFTGTFEPDVTLSYQKILRPGDRVLDIGANFGAHTLRFAQAVGPTGHVVAFEPTRYALDRLRQNLALNPEFSSQVEVQFSFLGRTPSAEIPKAVSSSFRLASFSESEERNPKDFGFAKSTEGAASTTLDLFTAGLPGRPENAMDFVKLDVDGNETEVIAGASSTLKSLRPVFLVEIAPGHFEDQPERFHSWVSGILSQGYRVYDLKFQSLTAESIALWKGTPLGAYSNVWMVPEEKIWSFTERARS
ncbi:MAG: FkbM family methyltransferase [Bdellovibrionales bacterium]|nr:FkbM family methyltransferase [Bdellovibrionales bacterium]